MVVVAVEGPDCTGKSTFVERLNQAIDAWGRERVNLKFGPPDPPDLDPYLEYEHAVDECDGPGTIVVCDRLHWGERIYGPLLRQHDRLGLAGWRHVELSLAARNTLVVYVRADPTEIERCLERRGDHYVGVDDLYEIQEGYRWCLEHTALPVVSLRHLDDTAAPAVLSVLDYLSELRPFHAASETGQSYLGTLFPRVVLFGENRGGRSPHNGDRLAFVPRSSGSGRWLLEALPEDLWPHAGLANACDQDDPHELWVELDKPQVVALGGAAHLALSTGSVPHAAVPHPQFVRRFHHARLTEYGRLIEEVAGTTRNELQWRG